jgi:hypothetical protein
MDWLGSNHVGTSTDGHSTIAEVCFFVSAPCRVYMKSVFAVEYRLGQ